MLSDIFRARICLSVAPPGWLRRQALSLHSPKTIASFRMTGARGSCAHSKTRPDLVMLGGAVANGSNARIADRMNYWMTFAAYAPGQVTAQHPCISQLAVRTAVVGRALAPGELEGALIARWIEVAGAIEIDPAMIVLHVQSHGFWNTFAVHFHNGRATGGYSSRRGAGAMQWRLALRLAGQSGLEHVRRTDAAFRKKGASPLSRGGFLLFIAPLLLCHMAGEVVGYRYGVGSSPERLV